VKEYDRYLPIVRKSNPKLPEEQKKVLRRELNDAINVGLLTANQWEILHGLLNGTKPYAPWPEEPPPS